VINQVCHGTVSAEAAQLALESAGGLPPASTPRFTLFAAIGAASLGVIFGTLAATSLLLIAASAAIGALVRRWQCGFSNNPLIQPLYAAFIAGIVAAAASRFQLSDAITLVGFCPCMVLVPGPHILNGAIDLARTRVALGLARLAYAGVIVLLICAGGLFGVHGGRRKPRDSRIADLRRGVKCRERRHGISDHHGHDLRADPPAHAVRARIARASVKSGMDVLCPAPPFKISPKPCCIRC
jgi:Putative threonine/serine exporter